MGLKQRLFIPHKDKKDEQYRTDMQTVENYVNGLSSGSGVTKITIGATGSHGKQIEISPTPTGVGTVVLTIPTTLDITVLKASQIEPSGGSTSITVTGNTITIKGSTDLYLAGVIKLLRTSAGVTGSLATAASYSTTTTETVFKAAKTFDTYRSMSVAVTTLKSDAFAYLRDASSGNYLAGFPMSGHPTAPFPGNGVVIGQVWVPAGSALKVTLNNCTFQTGYLTELG